MLTKCSAQPVLKASMGAILPLFAVFLTVIVSFLGASVYLGLNTTVQDELQKAVSTAAMVGASSFFDGDTQGAPVKSPQTAEDASKQIFNKLVAASPSLTSYKTQLTSFQRDDNLGTVSLQARALIPTPFLSFVGISSLEVHSQGRARYARQALAPSGITLGYAGGPAVAGCPVSAAPSNVTLQLQIPVVDRPGPDLQIRSASGQGYIVEACDDASCYDVGLAAKPEGTTGMVRSQTYPDGSERTILYGASYIDLGATNGAYTQSVRKFTRLKILDDGIPDRIVNGVRSLETCPQGAQIDQVDTFHVGVGCPFIGGCSFPAGFYSL